MSFSLTNNKSILTLTSTGGKQIHLFVSREITNSEMNYASLNEISSWSPSTREAVKISELKNGWKISINNEKKWRKWWIKFNAQAMIFPTREGEYISNFENIKNFHTYSLSYPGTASTKCAVIFTESNSGFVVCAEPNLNWAKISLTKVDGYLMLQFLQHEHDLYIFPFEKDWKTGIEAFRDLFFKNSPLKHKILKKPRFLLQMGVRDFFGNTNIKKFTDLLPLIADYRRTLGPGNIIHLFGTNNAGFDTRFPNFEFDKSLGGVSEFKKLVNEIHKLDLMVSHHFNPRIADSRWIEENQKFKKAIVVNPSGNPWIEFYKNNIYYVMDPNNKEWLSLCIKIIRYFKKTGIDFIELDQIAYQRNLYTDDGGFGEGYQKLIDLTKKESINFWTEGVSDIYRLPPDCYFQVLPRDRKQLWETNENRRGYVYGTQFTIFYRTLMPHTPISYQIVTERPRINIISKRLQLAKRLKAQVYDLELGFVDRTYKKRLDKTLKRLKTIMREKY